MVKLSKTDQEFYDNDEPNTKLTQTIFDGLNHITERYQVIITNFESSRYGYIVENSEGQIMRPG